MLKIKILKSESETLTGKTLHLEKKYDKVWACSKTNIHIIDPWDELDHMDEFCYKNHTNRYEFMNVFIQSENEDKDINIVEYIPSKYCRPQFFSLN